MRNNTSEPNQQAPVTAEGLEAELRSLHRVRASHNFSHKLRQRLHPEPAAEPTSVFLKIRTWPLAAQMAGLACGLLLLVTAVAQWPSQPRAHPISGFAQMEQEHRSIEQELAELRSLSTPSSNTALPVVYVGGDERYDVVVDPRALLASYHGDPILGAQGSVPSADTLKAEFASVSRSFSYPNEPF